MTDGNKSFIDRIDRKTLAILLIVDLVIVVGLAAWVNIETQQQLAAHNESATRIKLACHACLDTLPPWARYNFPANETACPVCNISGTFDLVQTPKVLI